MIKETQLQFPHHRTGFANYMTIYIDIRICIYLFIYLFIIYLFN